MDRKKLIYIMGGITGGIILLIVIIFIVIGTSNKTLSYDKIEDRLRNATENYLSDNENMLPKEESGSVTVDVTTLENGGYIKSMSKMLEEGISCSAKVIVTKNGENYLYSPILNCGEEYKTEKFSSKLLSDNKVVTSGDGLYKEGSNYRFKGEYINNYVSIENKLWRILDIDEDGFARLLYVGSDEDLKDTYVWDDRYNIDTDDYSGINNYSLSRLKESLIELETNDDYVSNDNANLAYRAICVGKRSSTNLEINNNEECKETINNQLYGLPYVNDYVAASIDTNCKTIEDESCSNYNYLMTMSLSSYTLTASKEKSGKVYFVTSSGAFRTDASNDKRIRPTIYISNNALYADGDGTKTNPYTLK